MYLSKLSLDPKNAQVQSELANRYELHRTLTAQFPEKKRKDIGLLYRIELQDQYRFHPITLLIQTQLEPDWNGLYDRGLLIESSQVKAFTPNFSNSEKFYFRLLGNPTARRRQLDGSQKRVGLYDRDEQQDWILRKAQYGGFKVLSLQLTDFGLIESSKKKNNQTFKIKHLAVKYEGLLQIIDPDKFTKTFIKGIGSAKAFGFGLLSLAKS
jgi:CRISPR system Cascade subunit CasE